MIRVTNLNKSFDGKQVLKDISFEADNGNIIGVTGPSGIGKTTLLHIILNLMKPDSGEINLDGMNAGSAVFQEDRLIENLTAIENIKIATDADDETITRALKELIPNMDANTPVSKFSGGMRRRVAIIRAMLKDTDVIVMDEPFTGLDDDAITASVNFILSNKKDRTLFIATHNKAMDFDVTVEIK